ncbi:MAG: hypothetical protein B6244_00300 [Candidatus Cloacimonetes bacterium 4572_55]|nr:MAG: hypothetical protein B6244_00300 [Candidatus Cloacimonetes bacterium 4572_55]
MEITSSEIRTKDGYMIFLKSYPYIPRTILGEIPVPQEPGIVSSVDMYRYFFHVKDMTYYPYFKILVFHYQPSSDSIQEKILSDAELENGDKLFAKYGVYPKRPEEDYLCSGSKLEVCLNQLIKKLEVVGQEWLLESKADELQRAMGRNI